VTQAQVIEIAPAAAASPEHEVELLALAADTRSQAQLRDRCRRVKAAATDALAQHNAVHAARAVRTWTDPGGTWHLHANGTPSEGARILARLNAETEAVFAEARTAGVRDAVEAYRFDALVRIAESTGDERTRAKAHLFVNVDAEKLTGGDQAKGVCEIKGVGPVPVATARELLGDALLTILVKKGVDVTTIAHDGTKTMPIAVRRAVLARDPECVVDICSAPTSEVHHVDWRSDGGKHSVHNCRGLCGWCHDLVHYHGYTLEPNGDGTYHLRAPPGVTDACTDAEIAT
ncbi:MAG TPA: HNH endonuclease signature motif containing protein, partial [Acidimicrobiia bacterium]